MSDINTRVLGLLLAYTRIAYETGFRDGANWVDDRMSVVAQSKAFDWQHHHREALAKVIADELAEEPGA